MKGNGRVLGSRRSWTDDDLVLAVAESYSIAQTLRKIKLKVTGANYAGIKLHIRRLGLNTDH